MEMTALKKVWFGWFVGVPTTSPRCGRVSRRYGISQNPETLKESLMCIWPEQAKSE